MKRGVLHLIPNILAEGQYHVLPSEIKAIVSRLNYFGVEEIKSARRLLKALNKEIQIDQLTFFIINEHEQKDVEEIRMLLKQGEEVGYISEAGCAGVADPGQEAVRVAHETGAIVKPYVGPNSILLALMGSGFSGQHFQFHGYLPNKQPQLDQKIKELERESRATNSTQIFIETPYRNNQMLQALVNNLASETKLCMAIHLTSAEEEIISKSIHEWKTLNRTFPKVPVVFLIWAGIS